MTRKLSFEEWKAKVDACLERRIQLCSMDIPDWDYWHAWDCGMAPSMAASQALRAAREF